MSKRGATFFIGHDLRILPPNPNGSDPYVGPLPGNRWPEHFTIIPPVWELENEKPERVFKVIGQCARTLSAFDVTPTGDASFGRQVTLVDGLEALHYMMVGILDTHGYADQYPRDFIGPDYNGHTSHVDGTLPPLKPTHVDHVSIFRHNVLGEKFVERRIKLKGK